MTQRTSSFDRNNADFFNYYKLQQMMSDDDLFQMFEVMREHLPISFRLVKYHLEWTKHKIEFSPLPFLDTAYQTPYNRKEFRESEIFNFITCETQKGGVWRAETVSMIPPVLLNVQEHDVVLDMCAAPGSKTSQLAEGLNGTGLLIANDANKKRASMLIHQLKVISPSNMIFTSHPGQQFPVIYKNENNSIVPIFYDKILCDVPCSGDGTARKNVNIWRTWSIKDGLGLHNLQCSIAMKAVQQLKVGGRMVYSTCSLNPIENEAVVLKLLKANKNLKIVPGRHLMKTFKTRPGLTHWVYPEGLRDEKDNEKINGLLPGMDILEYGLHECLRIYPHDNNTGAFFVCLLEKTADSDFIPQTRTIKEHAKRYNLDVKESGLFRDYINRADKFKAYFMQQGSQADLRCREMFPFMKYCNKQILAVESGGRNRGFFYMTELCYNVVMHTVPLHIVNAGCKFMSGLRGAVRLCETDDMALKEAPRFHDESLRDVISLLKEYRNQFIISVDHHSLINLMKGNTHYRDLTASFVDVVSNLSSSAFILEYQGIHVMYFAAYRSKVSIILLQDKEDLKSTFERLGVAE
eukprot:NODE_41_length_29768_cov_0.533924.p2 type:complete len:578 gc:universal NODE_41_length_29768_cov_0.533924:1158-2891(+)